MVLPIEVLDKVYSPSELMPIMVADVHSCLLLYNIHIIFLPVSGFAAVCLPSEVESMVWGVHCLLGELILEVFSVEFEWVAVMDILFSISLRFFVLLG